MAVETLEATLVGTRPLLMHNGRLANPFNYWTKRLKTYTDKKGKAKTEEVLEMIARVEWMGSLYTRSDEDTTIGLPEDNVLKTLIEGARKSKNGKGIEAGVVGTQAFYPLKYKGPKDPTKLYNKESFNDYRGVCLSGRRIMRSRPIFHSWSLPVSFTVVTDVVDMDTVKEALNMAGLVVGLGDYRPRYGRFTVEW